ncbi:MAG: diaminopimelate epimerase [Bacteroidales bacterium]|nr:diaminopimelate epimerase [Bacteroidales bacterium]
MMKFYKYQGAGNDFLIADNRDGSIFLTKDQIASVCDRRYGVGADGLMLLEASERHDFRMTYYNSDGSGGMMCGNGGRCIVAFAADMGLEKFDFDAADGFHTARILKDEDGVKTVRLKMKDVTEICRYEALEGVSVPSEGYFLDTGTRHYVRFVKDLKEYDIVSEGREIRYDAVQLQPVGVNVNFVEPSDGILNVRTYEKGVEDETYACGTGIVASCIAAYEAGVRPSDVDQDGRVHYDVHAKKDVLAVDFLPSEAAEDVWLTGPASFVAEILIK